MPGILQYLRSFRQLVPQADGDGELLKRFRLKRDEMAFATLVQRHGPMVLGMARRVLGHSDLTEDVLQATFLVLARRAKQLEDWPSVAGWLVQVTRRTALQARAKSVRRNRHEQQAVGMTPTTTVQEPVQQVIQRDLAEILDAEVARLPSKYRTPMVLCHLQGQTKEETARQLGWPVGSVSGRLARGRKLLQERLLRRGIMPTLVAGALTVPRLDAQVTSLLIQATTLLATNVVHQSSKVSASAAVALAQGVMTTMYMTKLKYAAAILALLALCLGTGAWALSGNGDVATGPRLTVKGEAQQEHIYGTWLMEKSTAFKGDLVVNTTVSPQPYWKFVNSRTLEMSKQLHPEAWTQVKYQLDDSTNPATIALDRWTGTAKVSNGQLHINLTPASQKNESLPKSEDDLTRQEMIFHLVSDYDRLEGVWRREERNKVTDELIDVDELIFRKNYYVQRSYSDRKGGMNMTRDGIPQLQNESPPHKFELHEEMTPKGIDMEVRDAAFYRENPLYILPKRPVGGDAEAILNERKLGIYSISDNELKLLMTGKVPYEWNGERYLPNAKSSKAKRGTNFEELSELPVMVYKRVPASYKDMRPGERMGGGLKQPRAGSSGSPQGSESNVKAGQEASSRLLELKRERLKLAQEQMRLWNQANASGNGTATMEELGQISKQILEASVALATTEAEKLKAMEEHLKVLKQAEQVADIQYKSGSKTRADILKVQLKRVEFEIQMEQMRGKR